MASTDRESDALHAGQPERRQVALKTLFVVTTLSCGLFADIHWFGLPTAPLYIQSIACATLAGFTRGKVLRGLATGFVFSILVAALLLRPAWSKWPTECLLVAFSAATLGGWVGAAIDGVVNGYRACVVALVLVFAWVTPLLFLVLSTLFSG